MYRETPKWLSGTGETLVFNTNTSDWLTGDMQSSVVCSKHPGVHYVLRNALSIAGNSMTPALRGPLRNNFWKKRRPQPLYWRGDNSGNALEASNALNHRVWGIPAVLSTGIPGKALRAFPGSFRNFSGISSGKSQPYWGCGLLACKISLSQYRCLGMWMCSYDDVLLLLWEHWQLLHAWDMLAARRTLFSPQARKVLEEGKGPPPPHFSQPHSITQKAFTLIGWQPGSANTGFCSFFCHFYCSSSGLNSANTLVCDTLALSQHLQPYWVNCPFAKGHFHPYSGGGLS